MNTLVLERECLVCTVGFSKDSLFVDLSDGRRICIPLAWYPRLLHATRQEREQYELIGDGEGIHWPELDEDISVEGMLAGRSSQESQPSLQKWIKARNNVSNR
jgi:hypothetical protein